MRDEITKRLKGWIYLNAPSKAWAKLGLSEAEILSGRYDLALVAAAICLSSREKCKPRIDELLALGLTREELEPAFDMMINHIKKLHEVT